RIRDRGPRVLWLNMQRLQQAEHNAAENTVQELGECKLLHKIMRSLDTLGTSVASAQRGISLVCSFHQHGWNRCAHAKQESSEGPKRTLKYTIADRCNQQITQEKAHNNHVTALPAMLLDNAIAQGFDASC